MTATAAPRTRRQRISAKECLIPQPRNLLSDLRVLLSMRRVGNQFQIEEAKPLPDLLIQDLSHTERALPDGLA